MELIYVGIAALVILATIFSAYVVYENDSQKNNGKSRSFFLFFLGVLISGILTPGLIGHWILDIACPIDHSGAGCAMIIMMVIQPFSSCIGIALFIFIWAKTNNQGYRIKTR
jgi:tryptophan-rich sensory protein